MEFIKNWKDKYKLYKQRFGCAMDAFLGYEEDPGFEGFTLPNELEEIISQSIQRRITDFAQVKIEDGKVSAMDSTVAMDDGESISLKDAVNNRFNQYDGTNISDNILAYYASKGFMGYQNYAILGQNKWISKAICMPVKDALRPGFIFIKEETDSDDDNNDKTEEVINKFDEVSEKMELNKKLERLLINSRQFGVGYALPIIDDDEWDLSKPFNLDGVKPGTYKGIKIIDPFWMRPALTSQSAYDVSSIDFFVPDYYTIGNNQTIHKSHLIKIIFKEVPDILKPTYFYGGMSLTQMIYEQVFLAEQTSKEAPKLVQNKRLLIMSGSLEESVRNTSRFENKLKALLEARNNYGVYLTDINENVQQIETSLMEFPELISNQYLLIAGIAEIPYTKFMGTTPKGFNTTGEYEMKSYIQMLKSLQDNFKPLIQRHIDLLSMSIYGKKQKITFKFNEIDMPTEQESAQVNSIQTQTLNALIESGIVSPEEARKWLKMDENSGFSWIDDEVPEDAQMAQEMEMMNAKQASSQGENSPKKPGNNSVVQTKTS